MRVKDEAERLCFAPTYLQKADGLTKAVTKSQRKLIFHHTHDHANLNEKNTGNDDDDYDLEADSTETGNVWLVTTPSCFRGGEC